MNEFAELGELVAENVDLAPFTTYKFGGPARWFAAVDGEADLSAVLEVAQRRDVEVLILGRGSNLVVSDAGFHGLVMKLGGSFTAIDVGPHGTVTAGAAASLPVLARTAAKAGRGGLEFLVAVPGSVGGAVRMNAGCHGSETGEWLQHVRVYRPGMGAVSIGRTDLTMSYRHSSLPDSDVVLNAEFRTIERPRDQSEEIMRDITQWRKENQPGGTFNAGSVFKNPPGTSAGWLIDSLGLKGHGIGGARVSTKHANFFEAAAGTRAQDLFDLVSAVRARVAAETGIELEPEIRFVGDFTNQAGDGRQLVAPNGQEIQ